MVHCLHCIQLFQNLLRLTSVLSTWLTSWLGILCVHLYLFVVLRIPTFVHLYCIMSNSNESVMTQLERMCNYPPAMQLYRTSLECGDGLITHIWI